VTNFETNSNILNKFNEGDKSEIAEYDDCGIVNYKSDFNSCSEFVRKQASCTVIVSRCEIQPVDDSKADNIENEGINLCWSLNKVNNNDDNNELKMTEFVMDEENKDDNAETHRPYESLTPKASTEINHSEEKRRGLSSSFFQIRTPLQPTQFILSTGFRTPITESPIQGK
jgi:hypothetical protein